MDRFIRGQQNRQIALDWIKDNEWGSTGNLVRYLLGKPENLDKSYQSILVTLMKRLKKMAANGEIESRNRLGPKGLMQYEWRALTDETRNADKTTAEYQQRKKHISVMKKKEPWKTVHMCGDNPDIGKGGSGQGCIHHTNWMRRHGSAT
jgi:hypothetical protein